jgi:hypothetical protein
VVHSKGGRHCNNSQLQSHYKYALFFSLVRGITLVKFTSVGAWRKSKFSNNGNKGEPTNSKLCYSPAFVY